MGLVAEQARIDGGVGEKSKQGEMAGELSHWGTRWAYAGANRLHIYYGPKNWATRESLGESLSGPMGHSCRVLAV
jgi:hypothetical protein